MFIDFCFRMGRDNYDEMEKFTHTARGLIALETRDDELVYRKKYLPGKCKFRPKYL